MHSAVRTNEQIVPISRFQREQAEQIFAEVRRTGAKMVMKDGDPECVLLSPEAYVRLMDELEDIKLLALAEERMAHYDPDKLISQEELDREFGFTEETLKGWEEVEFE